MITRRQFLSLAGGGAAVALLSRDLRALGGPLGAPPGGGATAPKVLVYLSPTCGCCAKWVEYLRRERFQVATKSVADVDPLKKEHNVPEKLWSCHTAIIEGYALEGHVPAAAIRRLLRERPSIAGIAVAGMPMGSPGMEHGDHKEPFNVMSFTCCGDLKVFAAG